jgi:protein SCO1/2
MAHGLVTAALLFCATADAEAALSPEAYRDVGVIVPAEAIVPSGRIVLDDQGLPHELRELISRPTVLVFADYSCTTLCGPLVAFVASALAQSGLRAEQYRFVVISLDPKDGADRAARMRREHLNGDAAVGSVTTFATADVATVRELTAALGYRYAYDKEHDQFIHPAAAYVLRADGKVARVLTGLGLSGDDMRLALVEAGEGRIGTFGDQVRLICSGFDPAHGAYNLMVSRLLVATGLATVLAVGGLLGILMLAGRRRAA